MLLESLVTCLARTITTLLFEYAPVFQMAKAMAKLTGQPHGTMWMDFKKTFVTS